MKKFYLIIIFPIIFLITILLYSYKNKIIIIENKNVKKIYSKNKSSIEYYNYLFDSIEYDYYNLSLIYNESYNSIKIKHISNTKHNSIVCIFGILVNERGIEIANSMLKWLIPEYNVYCVYQKFPGLLYEYPALRFAQWFSLMFNISILLYVHTKGAGNHNKGQAKVRALWRHEFTSPRKEIYIQLLEKNLFDISVPYRFKACTWFNGMFISKRAFNIINTIPKKKRFYYESLFGSSNNSFNSIRFKGILNDSISPSDTINSMLKLYEYLKNLNLIKKKKNIKNLLIFFCLFIIVFFFKGIILHKKEIIKKNK